MMLEPIIFFMALILTIWSCIELGAVVGQINHYGRVIWHWAFFIPFVLTALAWTLFFYL